MLLFGVASRGAHMTAHVNTSEGLKIWVPRRARRVRHLFTYPGKLDGTVAGVVKANDNPIDCIIAKLDEEASLDKSLVRKHLRATGVLTYVTVYNYPNCLESSLISPEILYVYDL
jgi:hypothetical protein